MIYQKVKRLCDEKNIKVSKLEKILEFGNGTIHKWEKASPSADKIKVVADYFNVTTDWLLSDDLDIPDQDTLELTKEFTFLSPTQKGLVKCYISIIKSGQTV